jgi:hypothetical protein
MDIPLRGIELGRQFAEALDVCDYVLAAEFLTDNCHYERPGQQSLIGPRAICNSYRESDERARHDFDSVVYRSEVTADESGGIRLNFFDELGSGNAKHTFRCSQIVYFDENEKIDRIVLVEIVGERDRLNAFCAAQQIQSH